MIISKLKIEGGGGEGEFAPNVQDNREGLVLLMDAIDKTGYTGKVGEALIISVA